MKTKILMKRLMKKQKCIYYLEYWNKLMKTEEEKNFKKILDYKKRLKQVEYSILKGIQDQINELKSNHKENEILLN